MDEQLRDLAAAISTAIRKALTAGVDPQDILALLDEHIDTLEAQHG
jgi:hypothetical protein